MAIKKFTTLSIIGAVLLLTACGKSPTCDDEVVLDKVKNKFQQLLNLTTEERNSLEITGARPIRYKEEIRTYRCAAYMSGKTSEGKIIPPTEIQFSLYIADNGKDFILSYE